MVTKYIIMCGGRYDTYFKSPRQLVKVNNEVLVERTIRLLKENGITDISISTNYDEFEYLVLPLLKHNNSYRTVGKELKGYWCDAFYPIDEPVCYIFGDVYFSEEAIKTIVNTPTNDIEFFASMPPFDKNYPKNHEEPFALKVVNTKHLKEAIKKTKQLEDEGKFWRKPIMWELWTVIKDIPLQKGMGNYPRNYIAINDYTSDIDREWDIKNLENKIRRLNMIKCEVIKQFSFARYDELENIKRKSIETKGKLYVGDEFECSKEIADYLLGNNAKKEIVVKVIEVKPGILTKEQKETATPVEELFKEEKKNKKSKKKLKK